MTPPRFDALIHEPSRLQICGALRTLDEVEFSVLRDILAAADSVTSKHLKALEAAGYIATRKMRGPSGRPRTWARLTAAGRRAFDAHVAQLRILAGDVQAEERAAPRSPARRGISRSPEGADI